MHCGHFPPHLLLSRFIFATTHWQNVLEFSVYTRNLLTQRAAAIVFLLRSTRGPRDRTSLLPGMMHFLLPCFFCGASV